MKPIKPLLTSAFALALTLASSAAPTRLMSLAFPGVASGSGVVAKDYVPIEVSYARTYGNPNQLEVVFTAEVDPSNPGISRDGLVEYVADGVILLRYNEANNDVQLSVRIIKLRRANHQRRIKPYSITPKGIEVHSKAEVF